MVLFMVHLGTTSTSSAPGKLLPATSGYLNILGLNFSSPQIIDMLSSYIINTVRSQVILRGRS